MEIYTKVAGLKYEGRDKYVRETRKGQRVRLRRNENNSYDSNAIEVINSNGNMLGFIPKDIAAQLAPQIDAGKLYVATVSEVTGFKYGEDLGVSLLVKSIEQEEKLLTCCECGKTLSDKSSACPHCGCPTIETLKTIFEIDGTKLLRYYGDEKHIVVIPQFITEIESDAFWDKKNIVQVIIRGENVIIGKTVFWGCEALQRVVVEGSIKQIDEGAFRFCRNLEKINLPDGLISIQKNAFVGCTSLTNFFIPNSVEHIADSAFEGCTNIKIPSTDMFHFYGSNVFKNMELKNSPYVKRIITSYKAQKYNLVGLKEDGSIVVNFEGDYYDFQRNFDDWSNIVSISMDGKIIVGLKDDGTLLISPPENKVIFDNNIDVSKWRNIVSAEVINYNRYWTEEYKGAEYVDYFICIGVKETGDICISIPNAYIQYPEDKPEWCDEILEWKDIAMVSADKYIVGLKKDGTVVITGDEVDEVETMKEVISAWKDIEYILTSNYLVVGIKSDKTVVAAGKIAFYYEVADYQYERELSDVNHSISLVTNWENIERVSIVGKTIYGIRDDGRVYSVEAVSDDAYDEYEYEDEYDNEYEYDDEDEYEDEYDDECEDEYNTEHDDSSKNGLTNFKNIYDIIEGYKGNYNSQQIIFIKKDGTVETIYNNKPSEVDRATQVMGEIKEWKLLDVETDPEMCIEEVSDDSDDFDFSEIRHRTYVEDSGYTLADFGYSQEEYDNYWESTDY